MGYLHETEDKNQMIGILEQFQGYMRYNVDFRGPVLSKKSKIKKTDFFKTIFFTVL